MHRTRAISPSRILDTFLRRESDDKIILHVAKKPEPFYHPYRNIHLINTIDLQNGGKPRHAVLNFGDIEAYSRDPLDPPAYSYVEITTGVQDPQKNSQNDRPVLPASLTTKMSVAGAFGTALRICEDDWIRGVENLRISGTITENITRHFVNKIISWNNGEVDKYGKGVAGRSLDDPRVYIKLDFGTYGDDHPATWLRGKPKLVIYDYTTMYYDVVGRRHFREATIRETETVDGFPVTKTCRLDGVNAWKFLRKGCRIVDGAFDISHGVETLAGVCCSGKTCYMVVDPVHSQPDI